MIGVYDYTVLLTYISLISSASGIMLTLSSNGSHPYIGMFFLLVCGLCDAFDGKVARSKKDRSEFECKFGIQIDSLCDLISFGILPACIGAAALRNSKILNHIIREYGALGFGVKTVCYALLVFYVLAAMIRLAYFNVTEEERQKTDTDIRKYYVGLPVTSAALIFPTVLICRYITGAFDITPLYFLAIAATGYLFVSRVTIKKPTLKGILIMVGIGLVEFILIVLFYTLSTK